MAIENNLGVTPPKGEKATSGFFAEGPLFNLDRLDTQSGIQTKRFSLLARNPVVRSALDLILSGVFWPDASVKPNIRNDYDANPDFKDIDDEIITFVDDQLALIGTNKNKPPNTASNPSWGDVLKTQLDDARIYGFSISELIWDTSEGVNRLSALKPKPPWNFEFDTDKNDELKSLRHETQPVGAIKPDRFLIGTWPRLKYGNYYGTSDLQSIEHDINLLERLEESLAKGSSFSAYRPVIDHMSSRLGKEDRDAGKDALNNLSSAAVAHLEMKPDEKGIPHKAFEIEVLEDRASEHALESLWNQIAEIIKRINRSLGVPDDLGNVSTTIGSYARAQVEFDLFVATVERCEQWVEELANKIVCTIIYYNFQNLPTDYRLPSWSFDSVEEEFDETKARYYEMLIQSGIVFPGESFIRESFGFPPAPNKVEQAVEGTPIEPEQDEPTGLMDRMFKRRNK